MSDMLDLKNELIQTCNEILPKYGVSFSFVREKNENTLNSGEQINLLVGVNKGLEGNFVVGMSNKSALNIISGMTGQEEFFTLDNVARTALSDFVTILCRKTIAKIPTKKLISVSSPTLITGERICLMISKTPARKAFFKINDSNFSVAYSVEGEL
jgi:CheY-specific phosphatase CheX